MNLAFIVVALLIIGVVASCYVQRQSFQAVARLFDNPDSEVRGWLNPSADGRYMGRHVHCAYEPTSTAMKKEYSITLSTSVPWAFKAKQKNFASEFRRELRSADSSNFDEAEKHYAFIPLAFPEVPLSEWLRRPQVADAMNALFRQHGVDSLELRNRVLKVSLVQKVKVRWTPENVEAILQRMLTLVRGLEVSGQNR